MRSWHRWGKSHKVPTIQEKLQETNSFWEKENQSSPSMKQSPVFSVCMYISMWQGSLKVNLGSWIREWVALQMVHRKSLMKEWNKRGKYCMYSTHVWKTQNNFKNNTNKLSWKKNLPSSGLLFSSQPLGSSQLTFPFWYQYAHSYLLVFITH